MSNLSTEDIEGEIGEVRTNPALGVVGAIVGALLGAALWVVIYQFGIIASLAGIAIVFCACKGYIMLSKSNKLGGIIIAIAISVLALLAAHFLCWGLDIYREFIVDYDITLWDAILEVPAIGLSEYFIVDFFKELLMGLILIVVGAVPFVRQAVHKGAKNEE